MHYRTGACPKGAERFFIAATSAAMKKDYFSVHSVSRTTPALSHSASSPSALSSGPKGSWPRGLSKGRRGVGGERLHHVLADCTIQNRAIQQPESGVERKRQTETRSLFSSYWIPMLSLFISLGFRLT